MQPPVRVLLGAGCLLTVVAGKKLRRNGNRKPGRLEQDFASMLQRNPKEVVHTYASSPCSVSQHSCPTTVAKVFDGYLYMLSLTMVLMLMTVTAAVWRMQWDLVVTSGLACVLVVLGQLLYNPANGSSWIVSSSGLLEADDAAVILEQAQPAAKVQDLAGVWIKDTAACDSLEAAMDLVRLNGLVRTAAKLIKGVKITVDDERFSFAVFSVISWFKITESYLLNGSTSYTRRRDLRRGKSQGSVTVTPWGSIRLTYKWDEPVGGTGVDNFLIDTEGRLNIVTTVTVGGKQESYTLRYRRK